MIFLREIMVRTGQVDNSNHEERWRWLWQMKMMMLFLCVWCLLLYDNNNDDDDVTFESGEEDTRQTSSQKETQHNVMTQRYDDNDSLSCVWYFCSVVSRQVVVVGSPDLWATSWQKDWAEEDSPEEHSRKVFSVLPNFLSLNIALTDLFCWSKFRKRIANWNEGVERMSRLGLLDYNKIE